MLCHVALLKTDVLEECIASILVTLMMYVIRSSETSQKTAVFINNVVFWDVTPRGSCKSRRIGGT
jgi:hypothetical protein